MKNIPYIKFLILLIFSNISVFGQNNKIKISDNLFIESRNNIYGVVDSLNNIIIPFDYNYISFKNSVFIVEKGGNSGILNFQNKEIVPINFKYIIPKKNNLFIICTKSPKCGLIDNKGKIILPTFFNDINSNLYEEYYLVENEKGFFGVYDIKGNNIYPEEYIFYKEDNYKVFAQKDNKAYILDLENHSKTVILDENISFIKTANNFTIGEKRYQIFKQNGKFGVINSSHTVVIPPSYDKLTPSHNWKYYIIEQNNKKGLINIENKIIKDMKYDEIQLVKEYIILKAAGKKDEFYSYE